MAKKKKFYKVTNYGNTRSVFIAGQSWECPKNSSIDTESKEVADAFEIMFAIDVEVIKRPTTVKTSSQKKAFTPKKKKGKQEWRKRFRPKKIRL